MEKEFKQCQECKRVFKLPKSSQIFNQHSCPFCESWNTGYVDKKTYALYYKQAILINESKHMNTISYKRRKYTG